ncbi:hypothetical protein GF362_03455 [Candidatus Dojkabacteria bacterium]|nr:hypothetical protein [Candidatus Dojkabacteria bacterium]
MSNPGNSTAEKYFKEAKEKIAQGEIDEAVDIFIQSINVDYKFDPTYLILRNIKLNSAIINKLKKEYIEIIENYPEFVRARINLADLYTREKEFQKAIREFNKVLNLKLSRSNPEFIQKYWEDKKKGRPNFIIIGAEKSGTSSLFQYMINHPKILTPVEKETHFFTKKFKNGFDWYSAHFAYIPNDSNYITGEASTSYLCDYRNSVRRIKKYLDDSVFIAVLRNPVDRAVSNYYQMAKLGNEKRDIEQAFEEEINILNKTKNPLSKFVLLKTHSFGQRGYLWRGLYYYFFKRWFSEFPRERFLILKSKDLFENTTDTMSQVFRFLDLEDYKEKQYKKYNPGRYNPVDDKLRRELTKFFKPHNQKLDNLLAKDFGWE